MSKSDLQEERPDFAKLAILAKALRTVSPEHFDIGVVFTRCYDSCGHSCGGAGCAIGYAAQLPEFVAEGFELVAVEYPISFRSYSWQNYVPGYAGLRGYEAICAFFRISHASMHHLFMPMGYAQPVSQITPDMVADRIESFVEQFDHLWC